MMSYAAIPFVTGNCSIGSNKISGKFYLDLRKRQTKVISKCIFLIVYLYCFALVITLILTLSHSTVNHSIVSLRELSNG